ncbi:glycosyltransferase family 4 protein [Candidatus Saccharibacteria bacterium]|nr:glycosyltransferase family 4 protein [Candidatus Saccharibacteria bacterium]
MLGWELPPHNSGGLGVACYHMAHALAKKGGDISFVLPYQADHNCKFMNILAATHLDPLERFGGSAYDHLDLTAPTFESDHGGFSIRDVQAKYIEFVTKHLKDNNYDVIHAHDWLTLEAGVAAKLAYGVPLIAHIHATEFDRSGGDRGNPIIHEIEREGLLMADKILAVSEYTRRLIHEHYEIPLDKIEVAHNGFDPDEWGEYDYDPANLAYIEQKKQSGYTVISTISRLTIQKGLVHLLRAFALALKFNPKMLLVIAGDGDQRDELLALSAELGVMQKVLFTGFIRGREIRDIYSSADIFVMSSRSEPFGLTAFEAAHHGSAVVLTRQSGVAEVLMNVLKYDFWDEHRLADILVNISQSKGLMEDLQKDVRREYTKLPWSKVADVILGAYKSTLRGVAAFKAARLKPEKRARRAG